MKAPLTPLFLLATTSALAAPLPDQGVLKGRIVDWPAGQTGELRLQSDVNDTQRGEVFATGRVDAQGNFELQLPSAEQIVPSMAWLNRLFTNPSNIGSEDCVGEGTAAPDTGGFRGFDLVALVNGQEVGDVKLRSSAARFDKPGEVTGKLWFVSQATTLKGRVTCPDTIDDFDTSLSRGWNLLPARTMSLDNRLHVQYRRAALPVGLQWRLYEEFGGIGLRFNTAPDGQGVVVEMVAPGMPAEQAGLRAGDQILKVDGQDLEGIPLSSVVNLISGDPSTKLVLDVRRGGQVRRVEVTRALVRLP